MKKLRGNTEIKDTLSRLDKLTQEEARDGICGATKGYARGILHVYFSSQITRQTELKIEAASKSSMQKRRKLSQGGEEGRGRGT
jgi:hypothetical protein